MSRRLRLIFPLDDVNSFLLKRKHTLLMCLTDALHLKCGCVFCAESRKSAMRLQCGTLTGFYFLYISYYCACEMVRLVRHFVNHVSVPRVVRTVGTADVCLSHVCTVTRQSEPILSRCDKICGPKFSPSVMVKHCLSNFSKFT